MGLTNSLCKRFLLEKFYKQTELTIMSLAHSNLVESDAIQSLKKEMIEADLKTIEAFWSVTRLVRPAWSKRPRRSWNTYVPARCDNKRSPYELKLSYMFGFITPYLLESVPKKIFSCISEFISYSPMIIRQILH